jgi:hypothetical protein
MNVVFTYPISGMETERDFMRAHGKKQEGQRNVLPPQIFNGEKYCGVGIIFVSGTVSRNFSPVSCKKMYLLPCGFGVAPKQKEYA